MSLASLPQPAFYQSKRFESFETRTVLKNVRYDQAAIGPRSKELFNQIKFYFDEVTFRRSGVLRGEFLLVNELVLVARDGSCTKANVAWEDPFASRGIDDFCASPEFMRYKRDIISNWDQFPSVCQLPILSNPYLANYFHYTLETVPLFRLFGNISQVIVPERGIQQNFQTDLLRKLVGQKPIVIATSTPLKIVDPFVAHEPMSEEGIHWIRDATGLRILPGNRRIYLARTSRGTRNSSGGGIAPTTQFNDFLKTHRFETVDFGDRNLTVEQQVHELCGAGVILAPHGAALTNVTYGNDQMKLIEVVGVRTPRLVFMHLALTVGIKYCGVFASTYDENLDLLVDVDELEMAMIS